MKKILSLVLSFSLIFGSLTPSFAGPIRPIRLPKIPPIPAVRTVNIAGIQRGVYTSVIRELSTYRPTFYTNLSAAGTVVAALPPTLSLPTFLPAAITAGPAAPSAQFSQLMGSASLLGLAGTKEDLPVLHRFYETCKGTAFEPVTAVLLGRSMVLHEAYDELNTFIATEKPSGQFWVDLADIARAQGAPITAPVRGEGGTSELANVQEDLQTYLGQNGGGLAALSGDFSKEATQKFLALGQAARTLENPAEQAVVAGQQVTEQMGASGAEDVFNPVTLQSPIPSSGITGSQTISPVVQKSEGEATVALREEYGVAKEKVNTHFVDAKYAEAVSTVLNSSFDVALRKYTREYGTIPTLADEKFQDLLITTFTHDLEKMAQTTKGLSKSVQKNIITTFTDSLDPTKEIAPAAPSRRFSFSNLFNLFKKRKDAANAARVNLDARAARFPGLEIDFPVDVEVAKGVALPEDISITFKFADEKVKKAFIKRVKKLDSEHFVLRTDGALILRSTSGNERGITGVFFEGGQGAAANLYKILASRKMGPQFAVVVREANEKGMLEGQGEEMAMTLLTDYREALNAILSRNIKEAHPALAKFLASKPERASSALGALKNSGGLMPAVQAIEAELNAFVQETANTPIELNLFTDDLGTVAQVMTGISEGMSSVGQAITAALRLLGIEKGFLSNLPTTAGQFGPATAPLIGGLQSKIGGKHTLYAGQILSSVGNAIAMTSLGLGAAGVLDTFPAFLGMIGGILVNGIAGNGILKQSNVPLAKERANDPISASATAADLNSWASVGGIYCYLFLPVVGAISTALFGTEVGLGTLASMFGISTAIPLVSAGLMRMSKIKNTVEKNASGAGYLKTIGDNLKFAFHSKSLKGMAARVGAYHFAGMAFNSGPGAFFKEVFTDNPSKAMIASFLAVYLTVFGGRKIGAKMMKKGQITDKALIGLSSMVALGAGSLSVLPGLDIYTRGALWAAAGLGFANLANMEQAIELNRPTNVGRKAAVSTMYVLARMTGMLTIVMGAYSDLFHSVLGVDSANSAVYALTLPLAALTYATYANRKYITGDFVDQWKRWTSKTPKVLYYAALRDEVEQAMVKNQTWGTSMGAAESAALTSQVAAGITSRYTVDLSALETIRLALEDKAGLDVHRLAMARRLAKRVPSVTNAGGEQLTYSAFRTEVEPLYTKIVMGHATGMSAQEIDAMTDAVLDGIAAKYDISETGMDMIVSSLSRRTALNRNRMAVLDELFVIQLSKDAEAEIRTQLKNATEDINKQDVINHVVEKYQGIAKSRGVDWTPSPDLFTIE